MWALDLYFWGGGTLTVLYVTSWQSVGCQHTFPRLVAYLVVILLKSRQKQSAGWISYRTHIGGYAVYQGPGQKNFFSILEHFLTANGSAPLLDVTGWPCSISKKLSLSLDASPQSSFGSLSLKYFTIGALNLLSSDPLAFLCVRRRNGLTFLKGFEGI